MDIINLLGFLVGVFGLIFAVYENRKRKKLEDLNRMEAWLLYDQSSEVLSRVQTLNSDIKKSSQSNPDIFNLMGETSATGTQMVKDTIKLIRRTEPEFNEKIIDKWFEEKRIHNESHINAFKHLIR